MADTRQKLRQIGDARTHRGDALGLQLFGIRIEVVRQPLQIGVQQQRAVVETTVLGFSIGRAGYFARPVGGFHHQIVAPRRAGRDAQLPQRLQNDVGRDAFVVTRFAGHKGETGVAQVVKYRPAAAAAPRQPNAVLLHAPGVALFPGVLRLADHDRFGIAPQKENFCVVISRKMHSSTARLNQGS